MEYQSTPLGGAFAAFFMIIFGIILFISLISVISMWVLFQKAGKPGWASLIPIYNIIVMIEIVGKPMIWVLWLLFPCTSIFFTIWLLNLFVKSFGKSEGFTIGIIFLSPIFLPLLAFGNNPYLGPSAAEAKNNFPPHNFTGGDNPFTQPPTTPQA